MHQSDTGTKRSMTHKVHNHPSGTAEQSRADDLLTRNLKDALRYVDVKVQDHLIVAPGHMPLSFAEKGLL